jgi:iron complex transport system substrate-binding protein
VALDFGAGACGAHLGPPKPGWQAVPAVRDGQLFEIKSVDILQPGPAALTDGVAQLHRIMAQWAQRHG